MIVPGLRKIPRWPLPRFRNCGRLPSEAPLSLDEGCEQIGRNRRYLISEANFAGNVRWGQWPCAPVEWLLRCTALQWMSASSVWTIVPSRGQGSEVSAVNSSPRESESDQFRACGRNTRALSLVAIRAPPLSGKSIALAVTFQPSMTTRGRAPPRSSDAASIVILRLSPGRSET